MAIHKACSLCVANASCLGQSIEIIGDSLVAVNWINSNDFGSLAHVKMVYDIREFLSRHENMSVQFCSRASNSYADDLVKKGSSMVGDMICWGSV